MGNYGRLYRLNTKEDVEKRMNPNKVVGDRLCRIRTDRDMTQEQLSKGINEILIKAGAIGLPESGASVISKVESGERSFSLLEGMAAAKVLGVPVTVFAPWESGEYNYRVSAS